jgi:Tfp pilus assembly protein PilX
MSIAATHVITGLPALLIILVILALLVVGVVAAVRMTARGAKRVADSSRE